MNSELQKGDVKSLQTMLVYLGFMVQGVKLKAYVDIVKDFDSFAPFLDPTAWMQRGDNVKAYGKLAKALKEFQDVANEVIEESFKHEKLKPEIINNEMVPWLMLELFSSGHPFLEMLLDDEDPPDDQD